MKIFFKMVCSLVFLTMLISAASAFSKTNINKNELIDVAMDSSGNIYMLATHWTSGHPMMNVFDSEGKKNSKFNLRLPNFCCDPFPLRARCSDDGFTYILLPGTGGFVRGTDLQFVRIDKDGKQDKDFGDQGVLKLPEAFDLRSFDVTPSGGIWVLDTEMVLHRFDDDGRLIKIREITDIFPYEMLGGRFKSFYANDIFSTGEDSFLVTGIIYIDDKGWGTDSYFIVMEIDKNGKMVNSNQWQSPWFAKSPEAPSFFKPLAGKSIIRQSADSGSVVGFPEGVRDEPDPRSLVVLDWSMKDGFHFYNLTDLEIPPEIFLGYDLNQTFITRDSERTYLYFPFSDHREVLVVSYDSKGKIVNKFKLQAFI